MSFFKVISTGSEAIETFEDGLSNYQQDTGAATITSSNTFEGDGALELSPVDGNNYALPEGTAPEALIYTTNPPGSVPAPGDKFMFSADITESGFSSSHGAGIVIGDYEGGDWVSIMYQLNLTSDGIPQYSIIVSGSDGPIDSSTVTPPTEEEAHWGHVEVTWPYSGDMTIVYPVDGTTLSVPSPSTSEIVGWNVAGPADNYHIDNGVFLNDDDGGGGEMIEGFEGGLTGYQGDTGDASIAPISSEGSQSLVFSGGSANYHYESGVEAVIYTDSPSTLPQPGDDFSFDIAIAESPAGPVYAGIVLGDVPNDNWWAVCYRITPTESGLEAGLGIYEYGGVTHDTQSEAITAEFTTINVSWASDGTIEATHAATGVSLSDPGPTTSTTLGWWTASGGDTVNLDNATLGHVDVGGSS